MPLSLGSEADFFVCGQPYRFAAAQFSGTATLKTHQSDFPLGIVVRTKLNSLPRRGRRGQTAFGRGGMRRACSCKTINLCVILSGERSSESKFCEVKNERSKTNERSEAEICERVRSVLLSRMLLFFEKTTTSPRRSRFDATHLALCSIRNSFRKVRLRTPSFAQDDALS